MEVVESEKWRRVWRKIWIDVLYVFTPLYLCKIYSRENWLDSLHHVIFIFMNICVAVSLNQREQEREAYSLHSIYNFWHICVSGNVLQVDIYNFLMVQIPLDFFFFVFVALPEQVCEETCLSPPPSLCQKASAWRAWWLGQFQSCHRRLPSIVHDLLVFVCVLTTASVFVKAGLPPANFHGWFPHVCVPGAACGMINTWKEEQMD